jgi:5S rRNA maturation endonuclease (ribonuclease M5)
MTYDGQPAVPVWAATVANNLPTIAVIPGVKRLIILGDNDRVGERYAQELAWRWRGEGRQVNWRSVKDKSLDWNDLTRSKK